MYAALVCWAMSLSHRNSSRRSASRGMLSWSRSSGRIIETHCSDVALDSWTYGDVGGAGPTIESLSLALEIRYGIGEHDGEAEAAEARVAKRGAKRWSTRGPMELRNASMDALGDVGEVAALYLAAAGVGTEVGAGGSADTVTNGS